MKKQTVKTSPTSWLGPWDEGHNISFIERDGELCLYYYKGETNAENQMEYISGTFSIPDWLNRAIREREQQKP